MFEDVMKIYFSACPEYFCEKFGDCSSSVADKSGFEAIRWLHRQLDDDADGNVNIEETGEVRLSYVPLSEILICSPK